MVFNREKYPFLEMYLNNKLYNRHDLVGFKVLDDPEEEVKASDVFRDTSSLHEALINNLKRNKTIPDYYSSYVLDIIDKDGDRLCGLRNHIEPESGIICYYSLGDYYNIFYAFDIDSENRKILHYNLYSNDVLVHTFTGFFTDEMNSDEFCFFENLTSNLKENRTHHLVISFIVFKQLIENRNEVKLKSSGKLKTKTNKYKNNLRTDINIIDKSFFTTSYNFNSFSVKGHFRSQPYGKGNLKRKLIWIEEFLKKGYIRKSKISKQI